MYTEQVAMANIKLRTQRHKISCGLACVAMVANKAYDQVVLDYTHYEYDGKIPQVFREGRVVHGFGTSTLDLYNLLDLYGIRSNRTLTKYKGRDSLPDLSILVVCKRPSGGGWHWVVCAKEGYRKFTIYNPNAFNKKQSLKDYRPITSFLRIHI
jgi:ABC-type bacteriocin/lantibiotic exporter with double-glycine peptidase domain